MDPSGEVLDYIIVIYITCTEYDPPHLLHHTWPNLAKYIIFKCDNEDQAEAGALLQGYAGIHL